MLTISDIIQRSKMSKLTLMLFYEFERMSSQIIGFKFSSDVSQKLLAKKVSLIATTITLGTLRLIRKSKTKLKLS